MKLFSPFLIIFNLLLITSLIAITSQVNNGTVPKRRLKILVYSPTLGWSHMQFMGAVADSLVEAGHEVHFFRVLMNRRAEALPKEVFKVDPDNITNFMSPVIASGQLDMNKIGQMQDPFNGKNFHTFMFKQHYLRIVLTNTNSSDWPREVGHEVHKVSEYKMPEKWLMDLSNMSMFAKPFEGNFPTFLWQQKMFQEIKDASVGWCTAIVNDKKLISSLEAEHFDVGFAEMSDRCVFGVLHRIGAKTKMGSVPTAAYQMAVHQFGIPTFSSYVPNVFAVQEGAPLMSFWQRAANFYNDFIMWIVLSFLAPRMQQPIIQQAFGADFPALGEIARNISLLFVNSDQFFEFPRPISNKIINVGGLIGMESGELDSKLKSVLDNARAGAVLIAFGTFTNVRHMPETMKMAFLRTFARFPDFEFIWKTGQLENEEERRLFAKYKNVHPVSWVDQGAVLMHPKLRAFISHCGQNSLGESVRAGVPVLAIPLFGDQLYNTILAQYRGVAVKLNVRELAGNRAEELFFSGLDKILHDPVYRSNAQLISRKLALSPFSARQKLVRWVEFAAEFPELNELNLPWEDELGLLAYYSIDVILFTFAVIGAVLWVLFLALKTLAKCCIKIFGANVERSKLKKN